MTVQYTVLLVTNTYETSVKCFIVMLRKILRKFNKQNLLQN